MLSTLHNYCAKRFLRSCMVSNWCFLLLRADNNWFLRRYHAPTTHASVYWYFEIMILKGPEKRVQKVKLSNTGSTLGISFRNTFADIFRLVWKKVDLQILLRFRPARALLGNIFQSNVFWRRDLLQVSLSELTINASRYLPCRVQSSLWYYLRIVMIPFPRTI